MSPNDRLRLYVVCIIAIVLGVILGLLAFAFVLFRPADRVEPDRTIPLPLNPPVASIPLTFDFYLAALAQRYPIWYCLEGSSWTQEDHNITADALTTPWGWRGVNPWILGDVGERCDAVGKITVHIRLTKSCEDAAACVEFAAGYGGTWMWIPGEGGWLFRTATIWIDPDWWSRATPYWKRVLIAHEFGHVLSLNDTPTQPCGVTIMDYNWCDGGGYPVANDFAAVNRIFATPEEPAWERWRQEHKW